MRLEPPDVTTVLHMISRLLPDMMTSSSGGKLHRQRLALLTAATSPRQLYWTQTIAFRIGLLKRGDEDFSTIGP